MRACYVISVWAGTHLSRQALRMIYPQSTVTTEKNKFYSRSGYRLAEEEDRKKFIKGGRYASEQKSCNKMMLQDSSALRWTRQ